MNKESDEKVKRGYINIETPVLHHLNSFCQQIIFYTQLPYFLVYNHLPFSFFFFLRMFVLKWITTNSILSKLQPSKEIKKSSMNYER